MRYNGEVHRDTHPIALDRYHELLRKQTPYERLAQAAALTRAVRDLALAGIHQRHPGISEEEARVRMVVRLYGRPTAERLFGSVPDDAV